ncbi:MAG: glycosyltransferase [Thiotrichales bacterium]
MKTIGFVAIGRNEGEHLKRCLDSIVLENTIVVYVDSGSTDNSVDMAKIMGVNVVHLDMSTPFTAARARNAGYKRLLELEPSLEFIHFIDGDCHIADGWLERAMAEMEGDSGLGAVYGKRREMHPEDSMFNASCDLEWDTLVGGIVPFGGEMLMRVEAFEAAGLYNEKVIASEDFELWIRMNNAGWETRRINADMSWHDARITRISQWWKRSERTGHAYGQVSAMHDKKAGYDHHHASEKRVLIWGLALPAIILLLLIPTKGLSLLLLGLYILPGWRSYQYGLSRGWPKHKTRGWAVLNTFVKFPEAIGLLRWYWRNAMGKQMRLIEYK